MYIIMKLSGKNSDIRVWRSLVARLTGGQEAAGSSPVTRTSRKRLFERIVSFLFIRPIDPQWGSGTEHDRRRWRMKGVRLWRSGQNS